MTNIHLMGSMFVTCEVAICFFCNFPIFFLVTRLTAKKKNNYMPRRFFFFTCLNFICNYTTYNKKESQHFTAKKLLLDDFFVHELHFSQFYIFTSSLTACGPSAKPWGWCQLWPRHNGRSVRLQGSGVVFPRHGNRRH